MSRVNIWWPMYPADFSIDTAHLSTEEVGAYIRILNAMWRQNGSISCSDQVLSTLSGLPLNRWKQVRKSIAPMFIEKAGKWYCEWLSKELEKAISNNEKKRQNALKRWHGNPDPGMQMHSKSNATAMQTACPSPSPTPVLSDVLGGLGAGSGGENGKTDEQIRAGGQP